MHCLRGCCILVATNEASDYRLRRFRVVVNFLADLQVRGTPQQVYDQMLQYQHLTDCAGFIGIFSFGGMPHEMAQANMRLFAREVLPRLQGLEVGASVGTPLAIAAE